MERGSPALGVAALRKAQTMTIRQDIHDEIDAERDRQDDKWGWIGTDSTMAGDDEFKKLGVLGEEFGEVAKALLERDPQEHVEEELVQCAAVCVAWIEAAREKAAASGRFYIMAASHAHAQMVAASRELDLSRWAYITNPHQLQGVGAGSTILQYETARSRPDWSQMHMQAVLCRQRGARLIQVRESDLR